MLNKYGVLQMNTEIMILVVEHDRSDLRSCTWPWSQSKQAGKLLLTTQCRLIMEWLKRMLAKLS